MLNCEAPSPFVIVGDTPGCALAVPATSARAAAQAACHLSEHCPHTRATWQVNPHAEPGPVVVFGCARPSTGEYLLDRDAHAFPLVPGQALPLQSVVVRTYNDVEGAEGSPHCLRVRACRRLIDPRRRHVSGGHEMLLLKRRYFC